MTVGLYCPLLFLSITRVVPCRAYSSCLTSHTATTGPRARLQIGSVIGRSDCASESPTFDDSLLLPGFGLPGGGPVDIVPGLVASLAKPVTDVLGGVTGALG